jgi:hypothetical protein
LLGFGHKSFKVNFLRVVFAHVVHELVVLVGFVIGIFNNWGSLVLLFSWNYDLFLFAFIVRLGLLQVDLVF